VPSVDHRIHLSGTTVASGFEWGVGIYTPGAPVVQSGDQVCWQQYNASAVGGINLQMSSSGGIAWLAAAEDGQEINQDTVAGGWQNRCFSMTPYVGQTIQIVEFLKDVETPAGNWSLLFADLSYVAADGTVTQLVPPSWSCAAQTSNPGTDTSLACVTEDAQIATDPIVTANSRPTHFLLGDQLATAQMEFSSGGWPLWQGRFAPYGQELDNQTTANNYKYTGLERDSESDLDHADFRQLAYLQGRWMSTDPDDGSIDANNPQSLNRYAYVGNNPLSFSDPSGLNPEGVGGGAGAGIGCTAALGPEAGPACFVLSLFIHGIIDSFFDHPRLQGTTTPRPGARIWDEHGSYQAKPYSSAADILGLDNSGCEFGTCGGGFASGMDPLEDHHIFSQAFRQWFTAQGIAIDAYLIRMLRSVHRLNPDGLHTKAGGNWNKVWEDWIREHPGASTQQIWDKAYQMLIDFGIGVGDALSDFMIMVNPCSPGAQQNVHLDPRMCPNGGG
jgi:RHS repeat-associated protein